MLKLSTSQTVIDVLPVYCKFLFTRVLNSTVLNQIATLSNRERRTLILISYSSQL